MQKNFETPPDETKPWVYWYWLDGDLSKKGITKDLEAMKQAGIGEALIGHINQENAIPDNSAVQVLSERWWQLVDHAVREGQRLGVNIGMFNGPGWSQSGGPWITPNESMQYVVSSEVLVEGPVEFTDKLAVPDGMISEIAVLAFPAAGELNILIESNKPQIRFNGKKEMADIVAVGNGSLEIVDNSRTSQAGLEKAKWIWYPEGNPAKIAPSGDIYFRRKFDLPANQAILRAMLEITADNSQLVWVNGELVKEACSENWRNIDQCDITNYLKCGENIIAVKANNHGDDPSAAGLIAYVKVDLSGDKSFVIHTDSDWKSSTKYIDQWCEVDFLPVDWQPVKVLGENGILPWSRQKYTPDSTCSIDWQMPEEFTARSLSFDFIPPGGLNIKGRLEACNAEGSFYTVKDFSFSRSVRYDPSGDSTMFLQHFPAIFAFKPTVSKHFRLKFDRYEGVSNIKLSSIAMVENAAEKQLGRLWPTPLPNWDSYIWPQPEAAKDTATAIKPSAVINLSSFMNDDGVLRWNVPKGQWIIKRFGAASTEIVNRPAAVEATGLECDKMSKTVVEGHFNAMVGKSLERLTEEEREAVKHVVIDSYEVGGQNWTPGFEIIFKERLGYDPLPYLPVLDGRVVGSPDISERFLWDLRRLVADLISENYVGGLKDIANKNGLKLWLENYGHWGYPGEFLQYGGYADHVSGEFWSTGDLGSIELRDAASCVHTYGKKIVSAEAFTSGLNLSDSPFSLKARGDWAYVQGVNHFVLHVYAHQSEDMMPPGKNPWFGTAFHRNNPWFLEMRSWVSYLQRCHYMLQQGHHVADVAYFIGEDAPKMSGVCNPSLPSGYNYDYINADIIRECVSIKNGRWTLPDGMSYSVLVLPELNTMRPELLSKIRDLVNSGGVLLGSPPMQSPSLVGYPKCDEQVISLAEEIWGDCDGVKNKQRRFGKGFVFNGVSLQTVFEAQGIYPEIEIANSGVLWTHRADKDSEIYFISNQNKQDIIADMSFRVQGKHPEIWDPATGKIVRIAQFEHKDSRTNMTVPIDGSGSIFVVFQNRAVKEQVKSVKLDGDSFNRDEVLVYVDSNDKLKAEVSRPGKYTVIFTDGKKSEFQINSIPNPIQISGQWDVDFPLGDGIENVILDKLTPWSTLEDERIRSFAGTATYKNEINISPAYLGENRRVLLNLGTVSVMAGVRINGQSFATLWKPPFELDITDAVKPGSNLLEIDVTNAYRQISSGLIGPVKISNIAVVAIE